VLGGPKPDHGHSGGLPAPALPAREAAGPKARAACWTGLAGAHELRLGADRGTVTAARGARARAWRPRW
jgi:hypothetical protein